MAFHVLPGMLVWFAENPVDVEALPVASAVVILIALMCAKIQVARSGDGQSPFVTFLNALFSLTTFALFMSPLVPMFVAALLDSATSYVLGWVSFTLVRFGRDLHYTVSTENNAS